MIVRPAPLQKDETDDDNDEEIVVTTTTMEKPEHITEVGASVSTEIGALCTKCY